MRRVEFKSPAKADVAVLSRNLELWPVLREVVDGWGVVEIETIQSPIGLLDAPRILRTMRRYGTTLGYASMVARICRSGAKVLVAVDQTVEVVEQLGRLLPEVHQVLISHGSVREERLASRRICYRRDRVLCVWGQSDVDIYRNSGEDAVSCQIVGSLRNADYCRRTKSVAAAEPTRPLLLISQYSGNEEESLASTRPRDAALRELKAHLHRYCLERELPLAIALRPPVSSPQSSGQQIAERDHYEQVFAGVRLSFTDPTLQDATYVASDESDVTIGVPEGALTESFARGNKVLMFRQRLATGSYYGFPIDGDFVITEPDYWQFARRLDDLRQKSKTECATRWRTSREYMMANADSDLPIKLVRELIEKAL